MAELSITPLPSEQNKDVTVIAFNGEFDHFTFPAVEERVETLLNAFRGKYMIFDFTKLRFINSEGIGFLVSVSVKLKKHGAELLLCSFQANVADVIQLVGLPKMVKVFDTLEQAVSSLSPS